MLLLNSIIIFIKKKNNNNSLSLTWNGFLWYFLYIIILLLSFSFVKFIESKYNEDKQLDEIIFNAQLNKKCLINSVKYY